MENLQACLSALMKTDISGLKRLSGGASQESWVFSDGSKKYVLRRAPFKTGAGATASAAIGLESEAELIHQITAQGLAAPTIAHVCKPEDGIGIGFIMHHVEGETIARKLLRDERFSAARGKLAGQCGTFLAALHALPTTDAAFLPTDGGSDQIQKFEAIYRQIGGARPVFELTFKWLEDNTPAPSPPAIVHGDFRLGNLMVNEAGLAAVLDWELAHLGDPREDLAWICVNSWRFGQSEKRVGGFAQLSEMLNAYRGAGGAEFTEADIDWWEILGTLKWGIMCMMMYEAFRNGADKGVERAAIGRRVSETEIDLLNLLERQTHA